MAACLDLLHVSARHQAPHCFTSKSVWPDRAVFDATHEEAARARAGAWVVLILDDMGLLKKGRLSVGPRQNCGQLGKQDTYEGPSAGRWPARLWCTDTTQHSYFQVRAVRAHQISTASRMLRVTAVAWPPRRGAGIAKPSHFCLHAGSRHCAVVADPRELLVMGQRQVNMLPWYEFIEPKTGRLAGDGPLSILVTDEVGESELREHLVDSGLHKRSSSNGRQHIQYLRKSC